MYFKVSHLNFVNGMVDVLLGIILLVFLHIQVGIIRLVDIANRLSVMLEIIKVHL